MEKVSEELVREIERRAELEGAWDIVSVARELLVLRAGAYEAALAKVERDAARALVDDLIGLLDEHDVPLGDLWAKVDAASIPARADEPKAIPRQADVIHEALAKVGVGRYVVEERADEPWSLLITAGVGQGELAKTAVSGAIHPMFKVEAVEVDWTKIDEPSTSTDTPALVFSDVRPGDRLAGDPATAQGRIVIMQQICPSLTRERAERAAAEARRRGLHITVAGARALIEELFGRFCAPCSHGDHGKCRDERAMGSGIHGIRCACCYPDQG